MARTRFTTDDDVALVGDLVVPDGPIGAAVLCHPHPSYGGSRRAWMMPVLERALNADRWATLRFDFRGAGDSGGEHDGGDGEVADVAAAVDHVRAESSVTHPLILAGWSFGARVALRYAVGDPSVAGWAGIAPPVGVRAPEVPRLPEDGLEDWQAHKLVLHGTEDEFTSVDELEAFVSRLAEPKRVHLLEGGDHFLGRHGDVLSREIRTFATEVADPPSGSS